MSINSKCKIYKYFLFILIIANYQISSSILKIPFKIKKANRQSNKSINKEIEDKSFNYKLYSLINLGNPPQKIEASFNLKTSNFYISNYCRNSSTFYSFKNSSTFFRINTDEKPPELINNFYCNETFFFSSKKEEIKVNNMLLYTPESTNKNNCLNIGLKFPNNINNKFQESFIQQLKHKNIINKYFWTMNLYNKDIKDSNDYDGEFIFGDILGDFYPDIDKKYSYKKIASTYTGSSNRKNDKMNILEWGILFQVFYQLKKNENEKEYIYMYSFVSEFDFGINTIIGTFEYFQKIRNDYFNDYINKKICKISYMRSIYKYIYCEAANFGINDLKNFPTLNFRNKELKNIFYLNYEDLFYLSTDNKYYIFNIMITNDYDYQDNNSNEKWIFGLPFWRKYQFSFDIDNKLIYYYNKNGYFIDKTTHNTKNTHMREINDEVENINNDTDITNNQRIIDSNSNKKNKNRNNDEEIKIRPYIFIILLIIIFIFLFCFLVFLVKKTLFKKGYILMRNKKASELEEEDSLSSKNINFIKKDNDLIKKEIEMQNK